MLSSYRSSFDPDTIDMATLSHKPASKFRRSNPILHADQLSDIFVVVLCNFQSQMDKWISTTSLETIPNGQLTSAQV